MPPPTAHSRTSRSAARAAAIRSRSPTRSFFATKRPLQVLRRVIHRPPHVRGWTLIESEPFLRLPEVTTDDVRELLELDLHVRIERVEIIHGDEAARLVPLVLARAPVRLLDMRLRHVVRAEQADVGIGVLVAVRLVGE